MKRKFYLTISTLLLFAVTSFFLVSHVLKRSNADSEKYLNTQITDAKLILDRFSDYALREAVNAEHTIAVFSELSPTINFLNNPSPENRRNLEDSFTKFLDTYPYYTQARILDSNGIESIAIKRDTASQKNIVVPKERLQDKSNRYYFQDLKKLSSDEIYKSQLDLNIENGEIELPYVPTIRIGKKIIIGDTDYYLILNYSINWIREEFAKLFTKKFDPTILDSDGYWLLNLTNPEMQFGRYLPERSEYKFDTVHPNFWKEINSKENGIAIQDNLYCIYAKTGHPQRHIVILFDAKEWPEFAALMVLRRSAIFNALLISMLISIFLVVVVEYLRNLREKKRIERIAKYDELTGSLTRKYFMEAVYTEISRIKTRKSHLSLVYLDLNDLKVINDTLGHHEGDKYIRFICQTIIESTRADDVLGRIGGDEFLLLLNGASKEKADEIINNILEKLSNSKINYPAFAFGIESLTENSDLNAVIESADQKMYLHKMLYKNKLNGISEEKKTFKRHA